jgi:predicted nucleic acid-binding protein
VKLLFDTNVALDVILERRPHVVDAARLFTACESGQAQALVGATTVTTIYYVVERSFGAKRAHRSLELLLQSCQVADVDRQVLQSALTLGFKDFEDAVLHQAAVKAGCDAIVTRNNKDFQQAMLPVYTPAEACALLNL